MEQSSSFRKNILKFINRPLSNHDLYKWIDKLKIKHFRGIFSRDDLPNKIKKIRNWNYQS